MKFFNHIKLVGLMAGAALLAAQPSLASTMTFDGFKWGSVTTTVATNAPLDAPIGGTTAATGGFNVHVDSGSTFEAWCVDIWQWLGGTNYTYQPSPLGVSLDAGKVTFTQTTIDNLSRLATEAHASVVDATTSAAFQAAIWAIAFDAPGAYNLSSGAFTMSGPAAVTQQAQTWLDNLAAYSPGAYSVGIWSSPTQQDVVVFSHVPEPGTYLMLLTGLGLMGFTARRRNLSKTAAI